MKLGSLLERFVVVTRFRNRLISQLIDVVTELTRFITSFYISTLQDQFYVLEVEDPWLQEVVKAFNEVVIPFKKHLHQNIYNSILKISISEVNKLTL